MSTTQITVLVVAAVLVFWMVGAYNRLVALRNAIGEAWHHVDEALRRRGDAAVELVAALREPLAAEQGALDALLHAERLVRSAADALGGRPVMSTLAAALVGAESSMAATLARVQSLVEQSPALGQQPTVAAPLAVLADSAKRLPFARQLFNEAAQAYNAAARQFPTRLLTRLYGFGTAGRL